MGTVGACTFSTSQPPMLMNKNGKIAGPKGKTCPADGPALRARKAQSTGKAKKGQAKGK